MCARVSVCVFLEGLKRRLLYLGSMVAIPGSMVAIPGPNAQKGPE